MNSLNMIIQGVTKLWENCVCPKGDFEKCHKLDYFMGECVECGVGKLAICFNKCFAHGSWAMAWRCFEQKIVWMINERKPKKRIKEASKKTIVSTFLEYLQPKLQQFIKHNFVARDGRTLNVDWLWLTCFLTTFYHTLTLLKITLFRCKMKSNQCTNIHSKSIYWCT